MQDTTRVIYIYGLIDPRNGEIRYIGRSVHPERRLAEHLRNSKHSLRKQNWINKLIRLGLQPELVILQESNSEHWAAAEKYWIAHFRERGCWLVNTHEGGEGGLGMHPGHDGYHRMLLAQRNRSAETRAKLSAANKGKKPSAKALRASSELRRGVPLPESTRIKIGAANRGRTASNETREKLRRAKTGTRHSTETRKKISEVQRGRVQSPDAVRKRAAALRGHEVSAEARARISESLKAWYAANPDASKRRQRGRPKKYDHELIIRLHGEGVPRAEIRKIIGADDTHIVTRVLKRHQLI